MIGINKYISYMPFLKIRCCNRSPKGRLTWRRDDSLLKRKKR